jgi:hypothetical protein
VKEASLGSLAIGAGPANAIDYDLPNEKGIFGPNSFPERLVQMDLGRGLIFVKPKTAATLPAGAAIPYIGKGDDALPSVMVDFGAMQIAAELDTGNNEALLLPLSLTNRLSLENPPKKVGEATSAAGQQPLFRARLNGALRIGPLALNRPSILFIEGQPNVGLPVARRLVIVFDPSGRRSWLVSSRSLPMLNLTVVVKVAMLALASGAIAAAIFVWRKLRSVQRWHHIARERRADPALSGPQSPENLEAPNGRGVAARPVRSWLTPGFRIALKWTEALARGNLGNAPAYSCARSKQVVVR